MGTVVKAVKAVLDCLLPCRILSSGTGAWCSLPAQCLLNFKSLVPGCGRAIRINQPGAGGAQRRCWLLKGHEGNLRGISL